MGTLKPYTCHEHAEEQRHAYNSCFDLHRHRFAYAALVMDGAYCEMSADGRYWCTPGTIVLHPALHAHMNHFDRSGAYTISFPVEPTSIGHSTYAVFETADVGIIARLARRSPLEAVAALRFVCTKKVSSISPPQWCQDFAEALSVDSRPNGLPVSREHAARQFCRHFGLSPQAYRAEWRFRRALEFIRHGDTLVEVAIRAGYADQSHMTRDFRRRIGSTPGALKIRH